VKRKGESYRKPILSASFPHRIVRGVQSESSHEVFQIYDMQRHNELSVRWSSHVKRADSKRLAIAVR
jgi:hypothetical protein